MIKIAAAFAVSRMASSACGAVRARELFCSARITACVWLTSREKGYSEGFSAHMQEMLETLLKKDVPVF